MRQVLYPSLQLWPYLEAYYCAAPDREPRAGSARFSAVSTGYIKISASAAILVGQTTQPIQVAEEPTAGIGIKLRAGAVRALFGISAREITNQVVPLADLWGDMANQLIEVVCEARNPPDQLARLEQILLRLVKDANSESRGEQAIIEAFRRDETPAIARLATDLGYSPRQLQRKLNDYVGVSPSLFKRLRRFEKALELIETWRDSENLKWADVACLCGYSDQAHFIREFRKFAGITPAALLCAQE